MVNIDKSRATSTTRTVFRLYTNHSYAYEESCSNIYNLYIYLLSTDKANLLHILLSACDEWLVPIRGNIHRVMVIHDY
jgi:hypothetical protein